MRVLVVKSAFQTYSRGDLIDDPTKVADVLASANATNCVASEHPDPRPNETVEQEEESEGEHAPE